MRKIINLSELEIGQFAIVDSIELKGSIRRRVSDIGLIKGTCVKCIQKAYKGNPTAYCIRGAVIALRKQDTDLIKVILCNGGAR